MNKYKYTVHTKYNTNRSDVTQQHFFWKSKYTDLFLINVSYYIYLFRNTHTIVWVLAGSTHNHRYCTVFHGQGHQPDL